MSLEHAPARQNVDQPVYTTNEFCKAHRISRAKLYELWQAGKGPRKMYVDGKTRISGEAAGDWRRDSERPTPEQINAETERSERMIKAAADRRQKHKSAA